MIGSLPRAIAVALLGALMGAVCLVFVGTLHSSIVFSVHRLPAIATGFYPAEIEAGHWFVWTGARAEIRLAGLDRRSPWTCSVRLRGARPDTVPQPDVRITVDGAPVVARQATNAFQSMEVTVPARPAEPGLSLGVESATFLPGGTDPRALGVQVDEVACAPAGNALVLPPRRALRTVALTAAALGAALGFAGITAGSAVGGTALLAAAQAVPLSRAGAQYTDFPSTMLSLAVWMAVLLVAAVKVVERLNGHSLRNTARFAVLFSGGALYLKVLALLHPSKAIVDAVFHAHRFDAVLAGHFYFTQLSTSATPFPYAIGLYLFAAPWALLTDNHVALLRIVVCACEAVAGGLLYVVVVRTWGDRLVAAFAAGFFALVPVAFGIVGNANLTNAFGASAALVAVVAATSAPLDRRHPGSLAVVMLLATLALISHVTSFLVLVLTLLAVALLYAVRGDAALRRTARVLVICTVTAVALSVALYWGHFGKVYEAQFARMRAQAADAARPAPDPGQSVGGASGALGRDTLPLTRRSADAVGQTVVNFGWPLLLLALVGAWRLWLDPRRDRLRFAVEAWLIVCVLLVAASVFAPGSMRYQQDAWEFIGRVEHAIGAAVVILAAMGAAWAWRAGVAARLAGVLLVLAVVLQAWRMWVAWI